MRSALSPTIVASITFEPLRTTASIDTPPPGFPTAEPTVSLTKGLMTTCANVLGTDRRSRASTRLPYAPVACMRGASVTANFAWYCTVDTCSAAKVIPPPTTAAMTINQMNCRTICT